MAAETHPTYEGILDQAGKLEPADQLRLLEGLAILLRQEITALPRHSITELRGLGKEVWRGVDAQRYVDQERATWDG